MKIYELKQGKKSPLSGNRNSRLTPNPLPLIRDDKCENWISMHKHELIPYQKYT